MIYNRDLLTAALTKVPGSWQVPQGPTLTFQVGREVGSTTVQDIVKDVQGREYVTRLHLSQLALGCCHLSRPEACQNSEMEKAGPSQVASPVFLNGRDQRAELNHKLKDVVPVRDSPCTMPGSNMNGFPFLQAHLGASLFMYLQACSAPSLCRTCPALRRSKGCQACLPEC